MANMIRTLINKCSSLFLEFSSRYSYSFAGKIILKNKSLEVESYFDQSLKVTHTLSV